MERPSANAPAAPPAGPLQRPAAQVGRSPLNTSRHLERERRRKTKPLVFILCPPNPPSLRLCRDLLLEAVPPTRLDFTAVLPRFLSLYILSFLSPRDLCSAAQVCWHWRVLAEQVRADL